MTDLIRHKRQLLGMAKSWACQHLPGWSDDAHRDLIARHGAVALPHAPNRITATSMNAMQLEAALGDYERRGWERQRRVFKAGGTTRTVPPHIAHIVRLWARLGQAGKVQDASRHALLVWVERQVGRSVPNLDALSTEEGQRVIEALKAWSVR